MLLKLILLLASFSVLAQTEPLVIELKPITTVEELQEKGISEEEINRSIEASKKDLTDLVGPEEIENYRPIGFDVEEAKISTLEQDLSKQFAPTGRSGDHGGMIYVTWGYNRGFHSESDATFKTPDGTFTIHDMKAEDRPSTQLKTYLDVTRFSVPQYNIRIGYKFNEKWSVEIGTDHMKWIFMPEEGYEMSGDYNRPVWIHDIDANGNWVNDRKATFAEAKAANNASFLKFEHSDGYNYPHATAFYTQTLLESRNKKFRFDGSLGMGAGVLFPKTRIQIRDTEEGYYRDVDNKFHVAGWGAHAEANLKFVYKAKSGREVFLQGSNRGVFGKVNNALFLGSDSGSISQSPIYTYQVYVSAGFAQPLGNGKKKKEKEMKSQELSF